MEEPIIKSLKSFKSLKPDDGFVRRSRDLILASEQNQAPGFNIFESFKLAGALVLASVLLFVALSGLSEFNLQNLSPAMLSSLNGEGIKAQESPADFHIQIGQVQYDLGDEKEIGAKIDKLLKDLSL